MDDLTIRTLLSRFIKQHLNNVSQATVMTFLKKDSESELSTKKDSFAEEVALTAWNSLIYLLRQSFVESDRVNLAEVGEFVKNEDSSWSFFPAASLAEADAFKLPVVAGHARLASLALFHLHQGIDLAKTVPKDIEGFTTIYSEEAVLSGLDLKELRKLSFSDELRKTASQVERIAHRLGIKTETATVGTATHETPRPPYLKWGKALKAIRDEDIDTSYSQQDLTVEGSTE